MPLSRFPYGTQHSWVYWSLDARLAVFVKYSPCSIIISSSPSSIFGVGRRRVPHVSGKGAFFIWILFQVSQATTHQCLIIKGDPPWSWSIRGFDSSDVVIFPVVFFSGIRLRVFFSTTPRRAVMIGSFTFMSLMAFPAVTTLAVLFFFFACGYQSQLVGRLRRTS